MPNEYETVQQALANAVSLYPCPLYEDGLKAANKLLMDSRNMPKPFTSKMLAAARLAQIKHFDLTDAGGIPIYNHLEKVAWALYAYSGWDEDGYCIGMLHDILEDTDTDIAMLLRMFGHKVMAAVSLLTHKPGTDYLNEYIRDLIESKNILAIECKLCDLLHNTDPRRSVTPEQQSLRARTSAKYAEAFWRLTTARMELELECATL